MRKLVAYIFTLSLMLLMHFLCCRFAMAQCPDINVTISQTDTYVCINSSITLNSSIETELLDADYHIYWEISDNGTDFSTIVGSDDMVSLSTIVLSSAYYRCIVVPTDDGCDAVQSTVINVSVYAALNNGGSISCTISNQDTAICYNTRPDVLINASLPDGNNDYRFQWQQSTQSSSDGFSDIAGANGETYRPDSLMQTTYFRRLVVGSCDTAFSNVVTILVYEPLEQASLLPLDTTICYMTQSEMRVNEAAIGGNGEFANYWQINDNGVWHNIESATGNAYTTLPLGSQSLLDTVYYYRLSSESLYGCGTVLSDSIKVNVYGDLVVTNQTTDTLCYMTAGNIAVDAVGDGGEYSYQWQESSDGIAFTDVQDSVTRLFTTGPQAGGSMYYRCVVVPANSCDEQVGEPIEVVTYAEFLPGTISGNDTVCYNTAPEILNVLTECTGGGNMYSYMWQLSETEDGEYADLSSEIPYQPGNHVSTRYYRLKYVSEKGCGTAYSDTVEVLVYNPLRPASLLPLDTTICYMSRSEMRISEAAVGGNGGFANRWQINENGAWHNIESATGNAYTTLSLGSQSLLDTAYYYRLSSESLYGCGTVYSDSIMVNVYGDLVVTNQTTDTLCYMTAGNIAVDAVGEGGEYSYQWQESFDGVVFADVQDAVSQSFATEPHAGGSMYYRCVVVPTNGCEEQVGEPIEVVTYAELLPGTISGNDTVCYNTAPEILNILTECTGGGDVYSYMWQVSETEAGEYADLSSDIPYQPGILVSTSYYRLKYVSEKGCGTVYSDTVKVLVYEPLEQATLLPLDTTICYMTQSEMRISEAAVGGNGEFANRWQIRENGGWHDIESATGFSYTTESIGSQSLSDTVYCYRLSSESLYGCGTVYSDSIKVNVYGDLVVTNQTTDTLCYMTAGNIAVDAVGEGGEYSYQWQESSDGVVFADVQDSVTRLFATEPHAGGSMYYRCVVVPTNGCEEQVGEPIEVVTYAELLPGTIIGNDTVCYNTAPEILNVLTECTGGGDVYSYMWQVSETEAGEYADLSSEIPYQPENLVSTSYYRLKYVSEKGCGIVYSDTVKVLVNPLPALQPISGSTNVCINQYETYSVDTLYDGFSYEWSDDNNYCTINTPIYNIGMLEVLWTVQMSSDSIVLRVTNDTTGCVSENRLGVTINSERAPDRTIVARKPNSDILVTKEDDETLFYQWGFTERSSSTRTPIENSNRRYVKLPHSFDYSKYDYWLVLRTMEKSSCYSESYYSPDNDTLIVQPESVNVKVVSEDSKNIRIEVNNPGNENVRCEVYNIRGQLLAYKELGNANEITDAVFVDVSSEMLLVKIVVGNDVSTVKTIMR